jgi:hypothetical protein
MRNLVHTRRSPESNASYGGPPTLHESTASPLPPITNAPRRASVLPGGGYVSPEYQKPPTPYEDKVIPTLRNRNRPDGGHVQNSVIANNDAGGTNSEETESIYGGTNVGPNDDATAELTQAEMIEANQMMIVFDKQLVRKIIHFTLLRLPFHNRSVNFIIEIMLDVKKL